MNQSQRAARNPGARFDAACDPRVNVGYRHALYVGTKVLACDKRLVVC